MLLAWILTFLALCGAWAGAAVERGNPKSSAHLSAAGAGLLCGISLFWLVPEIGEISGTTIAFVLAIAVAAVLAVLDLLLSHSDRAAHKRVVWPLLLATAVHSLLDGWSVRFLSIQPAINIAVMAALALHKIPEGLALGWMTRRALPSRPVLVSFGLCCAAEIFTLVGAFAEPGLNASGAALLGNWWTAGVLSMIAGGFLFLALHAVLPLWRRFDVLTIFVATLALVGGLSLVRGYSF